MALSKFEDRVVFTDVAITHLSNRCSNFAYCDAINKMRPKYHLALPFYVVTYVENLTETFQMPMNMKKSGKGPTVSA